MASRVAVRRRCCSCWLAASTAARRSAAPAPDLEIVALQTTGPGRIGDCNAVVARLHNRGSAATPEAPAVRLDDHRKRTVVTDGEAATPLAPGDTVEVWFEQVPLPAGLSRMEATSDPDGRVGESDESNNTRQVPRDPQLACGAPDPPPAAWHRAAGSGHAHLAAGAHHRSDVAAARRRRARERHRGSGRPRHPDRARSIPARRCSA